MSSQTRQLQIILFFQVSTETINIFPINNFPKKKRSTAYVLTSKKKMKASTKNENLPHKLVEGSFREAAILSGDILLVPRAALCRDAPDSLQHLFLCEKKNVCIHFCIHFYMYTHTNMNMYTYTNMDTYIHFVIHLLQHLLLREKNI